MCCDNRVCLVYAGNLFLDQMCIRLSLASIGHGSQPTVIDRRRREYHALKKPVCLECLIIDRNKAHRKVT
jgi:hypothetical protein